jgi:hypothetical protein
MSGHIDIYEMAMRAETGLQQSRTERALLRKEGNIPSTPRINAWAPLRSVTSWTMRALRLGKPFVKGVRDVTPASISPGDTVS